MQCLLDSERGGKRVRCSSERGAECVARGLEYVTAVRSDALLQHRVVARERNLHGLALRLPQPGAAFDIAKKKRNGARGHGCDSRGAFRLWHRSSGFA